MNIILKSFDGTVFEKAQAEFALEDMDIGTCITISNSEDIVPNVSAQKQIWIDAKKQRIGNYEGVDWNAIRPLDAEIIEDMRDCEAVVLKMIGRYIPYMPQYVITADMPFLDRRRMYFEHLRYWNHMLEEHKIDILLMNHQPHQAYDYVLYELCRKKDIPVFFIIRTYTVGGCFLTRDWEDSSPELREAYIRLQNEYADADLPVELSEDYECIYNFFRESLPAPEFLPQEYVRAKNAEATPFFVRLFKFVLRKPRRFITSILSREFWARKRRERITLRLYDTLAREPNFSAQYIYVPLHLQPEASTLPFAGPYEDQELIVQMLAAHLPKGWRLYIKENPRQDERWRSEEFYRSLAAIPSVTLVPKSTDTYALLDSARAVATATGTVAFEAMLRQKPSLMFGHIFWEYGPGVFTVHDSEDCKTALEIIERRGSLHTERDARLFLRALEETTLPYPGSRRSPIHIPEEEEPEREMEKAGIVGDAIKEAILSL